MAKKYDLTKKSDMRRLSRDLEKSVRDFAKETVTAFDIKCEGCGAPMTVKAGVNTCPSCGKTTEVKVEWK